MTTLDTHVGARAPRSTSHPAAPSFVLFGLLRRKLAERRIYADLAARTDRELADIGVMRADLRRVAREAARGL